MAERPGGRGPTLYEVAGWLQGAVGVPFRAAGWLSRRDKPEIDRNDWRLARLGIALGAILGLLALTLLTRTLLIAFGLIDGVDRWSELRNSLLVIGVIVGAPFVVWRTMIADRQTAINQQTHYTDLYAKAVEMLGADKVEKRDGKERSVPNIEVRLGAIYALQRVMNQSDADYLPILKTLCAYVRENATFQERPSFSEGPPLPEPPEPPEARDETPEELAERLAAIRLHAQNLRDWGERLRAKAAARGVASAQRPDIRAALDVLCDRPEKRRLALEGIDRLEPPTLNSDWHTDQSPEALQRRQVRIEAHCEELEAWAARGKRIDLAAAALQCITRYKADLRRTNFRGARMEGAILSAARLQGAILSEAIVQGAELRYTRLHGAFLRGTQMQGADLYGAHLQGVLARNAKFGGTMLAAANFTGVRDLTYDQLASAFGDAATKLPPDLEAQRPRLIAEAGWAEDEIPLHEMEQRWADWRTKRGF